MVKEGKWKGRNEKGTVTMEWEGKRLGERGDGGKRIQESFRREGKG